MNARHIARVLAPCLAVALAVGVVAAQRRGGGAGGPGGSPKLSRLEQMTRAFKLDDDQVKQFRAAFDEGEKAAIPLRQALTQAHLAIGTTIQDAKGESAIDDAVLGYARENAAMTAIEVTALATAMKSLHPDQLANKAATESVLGMLHGMYLGKWDTVPEGKTY